MHKVLVAVDNSEVSVMALKVAHRLAKSMAADLYVLSVFKPAGTREFQALDQLAEQEKRETAEARSNLEAFTTRHLPSKGDVTLHTVVRRGFAWDEILSLAEQYPLDFVVIGLSGFTTQQVIGNATFPVVLVPKACRMPQG